MDKLLESYLYGTGCRHCGSATYHRPSEKMTTGTLGYAFKLFDHVSRPVDVYKKDSLLMYGIVVCVYRQVGGFYGQYPELYSVRWDDGTYGAGYLPHGIDKVEQFYANN